MSFPLSLYGCMSNIVQSLTLSLRYGARLNCLSLNTPCNYYVEDSFSFALCLQKGCIQKFCSWPLVHWKGDYVSMRGLHQKAFEQLFWAAWFPHLPCIWW